MIAVHPSVPATSLRELVGWIKAQPNPVNYGSGGIGSIGHLVGETLKKDQGTATGKAAFEARSAPAPA